MQPGTIDNDLRDILIGAGEGLTIDRGGDTLLSAMAGSSFVVLEPVARKHGPSLRRRSTAPGP